MRRFRGVTRILLFIGITLSVALGYFAYAQVIKKDVITINTVAVFPDHVSADGWGNAQTLTQQNLNAQSLYQDFNRINSAYPEPKSASYLQQKKRHAKTDLDTSAHKQQDIHSTSTQSEPVNTTASTSVESVNDDSHTTTGSSTANDLSTTTEATSRATETNTTSRTHSTPTQTNATNTTASSDTASSTNAGGETAMRRIGSAFSYMFAGVSKVFSFAQAGSSSPTSTSLLTHSSSTDTLSTDIPFTPGSSSTEQVASSSILDDHHTQATDTASSTDSDTSTTTASSQATPVTGDDYAHSASNSQPVLPVDTNSTESSPDTTVTQPCEKHCVPYSIELSGFGVPLFDDATQLNGAQLRVSFAAKRKDNSDAQQHVHIQYSLDDGTKWEDAGDIAINDEASNSINGGYYLFALPQISDLAQLDSLHVRIVYDQDPNQLEGLFVESAWLDLFTVKKPSSLALTAQDALTNDGFTDTLLSGDTLTLPDGKAITFDNTDENRDESLIIKSDDFKYEGLSKVTAYINVTNTSDSADTFNLKTYFPNNVGTVDSVKEWNQNKPKKLVIPEYRPFVYHCEGGWEQTQKTTQRSLRELSKSLIVFPQTPVHTDQAQKPSTDASSNASVIESAPVSDTATNTHAVSTSSVEQTHETPKATSTPVSTTTPLIPQMRTTSTNTISRIASEQLLAFAQFSSTSATTTSVLSSLASSNVATQASSTSAEEGKQLYMCRDTNFVHTCDSFEGDNTSCVVNDVKVREHLVTQYQGGWQHAQVAKGQQPDTRSIFKKAKDFFGFGPRKKEIPAHFAAEAYTPNSYTIQPGETKYFKIQISYPPLSMGEFWIEAVGDHSYGLLDPFWSSSWRYKMPVTIDNTGGLGSVEQQVYLNITPAQSDFWSKVKNDGGDIRFVREIPGDSASTWYNRDWSSRLPITIDSSNVDNDLTDFPVYVDLADLGSSFFNDVQADGADIRITAGDGTTELPYELVSIDTGSKTGELYFKANSISSTTDSTFYIYYNNGAATAYPKNATFGSENVWTNGYLGVYHLQQDENGVGSTTLYTDSTSNGYAGDDQISSTGKTGKLGKGQAFSKSANEFISLPPALLDGQGDVTTSYWLKTTQTGQQAIVSAANTSKDNDYLLFQNNRTSYRPFNNQASLTFNTSDMANNVWQDYMVTMEDASNEARLYVDGVPNGSNPQSLNISTLNVQSLYLGQEQDSVNDCCNATQALGGNLDELRFADVVRTPSWAKAAHKNQSDSSQFYSVSAAQSYTPTTFSELDYWIQHFDYTKKEANIWVQTDTLPAYASSTIYMYYGNPDADTTSDEFAPFTYSTSTPLYYVVNGSQSSPIAVYSLIDNNEVSIDGNSPVSLNAGESTSFTTYASSSVISALGPITAGTSDNGSENVVPISFATTTFAMPGNRGNESYFGYAPFANANVNIYNSNSVTPTASGSIKEGYTKLFSPSITQAGVVESLNPILLYSNDSQNGGNSDGLISYPATLQSLFGIHSTKYYFTSTQSGGDVGIYCSNGNTATSTSVNRGSKHGNSTCVSGSSGTGNAVRLQPTTAPIAAIQQADGNGSESTSFLPMSEMGTTYYLPRDADYVAIACPSRFGTSTIEVQNTTGTTISTGTCSPAGVGLPGALSFIPGGSYLQGYKVVSTNNVPFYIYYEAVSDDRDEVQTWSSVQAKKYNSLYLRSTFGAQEENEDAQYNQKNYRWYKNTNAITPTTPWDIDGSPATEGQSITGQGAVNIGDKLRLRMNLEATNGTGTVASTAFTLQYAKAKTCSAVTEGSWTPVGDIGSTTAAFAGSANAAVGDGTPLPSTVLSNSAVSGTYEEENTSATIPNQIGDGKAAEFDWSITSVLPDPNSDYCFRMVRSSGVSLLAYTAYPQVLTAGPPEAPQLVTPFDNERASSTKPTFEFVAVDQGGDQLQYHIQVSTDKNFGSTVIDIDSSSLAHYSEFTNINNSSDRAPFENGQVVSYTAKSALTDGTTYWWRVQAKDPDGSNTAGNWSIPQSFTVDVAATVSEWFQTTDEQFDTNSLTSAKTSGSDSVELSIAGNNQIGEYGRVVVVNGATTTVTLNHTYSDPVVVASVRYSRSVTDGDQVAARVFNKTSSAFDVLTDNYTYDAPGTTTVDYMVMEAGDYLIDDGADGLRVFATSTQVNAYAGSPIPTNPNGPIVTYPTSFSSPPVVLASVTTNNDPKWVVATVYDGNNRSNPPTASQLSMFLNDNLASAGHASSEKIDTISFARGSGANNSVRFNSNHTGVTVTQTPYTNTFSPAFLTPPGITLVNQLTTNGSQGSYAMVDTDNPTTANDVTVTVDEGGPADRGHTSEDVGIVAFEGMSGDIIRAGTAQMISTPIDFNDKKVGNAWGDLSWVDSGDVTYQIEYQTGSGYELIPDSALPGNSTGFATSSVNLIDLDTSVYNEIRLVANLSGVNPSIDEWMVKWGQRVGTPELSKPFDNEKTSSLVPTFTFTSADPQSDDLDYQIEISKDSTFNTYHVLTDSNASSSDFTNESNPGDSQPFNSGDTVTYTLPASYTLTNDSTYWWRVRAKDPNGGNAYSPWSDPHSFTVNTATSLSTWYQTTQAQFRTGVLNGVVASTSDSVSMTSEIGEYGTTTVIGDVWKTINTKLEYQNMVVVASPAFASDKTNGRTVQVRNKTANSFQIRAENDSESLSGQTVIHYLAIETGDWLLADGGSGMRMLAGTAKDVSEIESAPYKGGGTTVSFLPTFSAAPGALLTLSSNNNNKWTGTAVSANGNESTEVTLSSMDVAMGISRDSDTVRVPEDIDYVVYDMATGTNNGVRFDGKLGSSVSDTGTTINYNQTFTNPPGVTIVHENGTNGADGAFAQRDTGASSTKTSIFASIVEMGTGAGNHANEDISLLAFGADGGTLVRDSSSAGGLSGTIASAPIYFSDGAGPKFGDALFSQTSPGNSTTSVQVQYQTATGSWALIPDAEIPNNSIGNTTGTIDLTNVNIASHPTIRLLATLTCDLTDCPSLHDWSVEWSEGVTVSGTLKAADRTTNVVSGTVSVSVNGAPPTKTGTVANGVWSIQNVTAFAGDTVTVFVSGATPSQQANTVFVYDGTGDMTGVQLFEKYLSLASDEVATTTIASLARSDHDSVGSDDVFFNVDFAGNLKVCVVNGCTDASLYVGAGNAFVPATTSKIIYTHDFVNDGTVQLDSNTVYVSGSWENNGQSSADTSSVVFIGGGGGWYNDTWTHRIPITVKASAVSSDLHNFPVYVNFANLPSDFFGNVKSDGGDIRVTEADGVTEVPIEVVSLNTSAKKGELDFKAPKLSSSLDTVFYIYYDNPSATGYSTTDTYGRDNVWSDYEAVFHFDDTNFTDSTGNGHMPTNVGVTATTIGDRKAAYFDGNSYLNFGNQINMGLGDLSIVDYLQTTDLSGSFVAKSYYSGADGRYALFFYQGNLTSLFDAGSGNRNNDYATSFNDNNFHQAAVTYDRSSNNSLYSDGVLRKTNNISGYSGFNFNKTNNLYVGTYNSPSGSTNQPLLNFTGKMAELRFSRQVFVPQWLASENTNQTDPTSFYTVGTSSTPVDFNPTSYEHLSGNLSFNNLTFNDADNGTVWETDNDVVVKNNLSVQLGTLDRSTSSFAITGDLTTGTHGYWGGVGTTTFNGSGLSLWADRNLTKQNIGNVVVDGDAKMTSLASSVLASSVTIGADDTLNAGGSNILYLVGDFTNNHLFVAKTSTIQIVGTSTNATVKTNGSSLYNLTASTTGNGSVSFSDPNVTLMGTMTIATGTVTLATATTSIAGSFLNTGGTFAHNNGEVAFTGAGSQTIQLDGTPYLNHFYDVLFTGNGTYTFVDTNATTSNNFQIEKGTVVLPNGTLTVGGEYAVTDSGAFTHNNGEVLFLINGNDHVYTNGSSFNDVRVRKGGGSSSDWYDQNWKYRIPITVRASEIDKNLINFPVYVNLSDFSGTNLFAKINSDGGDIRMTTSDGTTEIAREVVSASTTAETGELHFLAPTLSSTTDSVFYLYYDNSAANDYAKSDIYGAQNVWGNNYIATYHLNEDQAGTGNNGLYIDSSANAYNGDDEITATGKTGKVGEGQQILGRSSSLDDYIDLPRGVLNGRSDVTNSFWVNTTSGQKQAFISAGASNNYLSWYEPDVSQMSLFASGNETTKSLSSISDGKWHYVTVVRDDSNNKYALYIDGIEIGTPDSLSMGTLSIPSSCLVIGQEQDGCLGFDSDQAFEGYLDEMTFRSTVSDTNWISASYKNQATTTDFYAVGVAQQGSVRTFSSANVTALGNVTIDSGTAVFPTGSFTVGGSFDNNGKLDANGGTIDFDSATGTETVSFGTSIPYNVVFDSPTGAWTILDSATTSKDFTLTNAGSFTLASGKSLAVNGAFTNVVGGASTTWSGTNVILSGNDYAINTKTDSGDLYNTLTITNDSDISVWNSAATTYRMQDTASLYSQNHNGVVGDLDIFGDYSRATGTEYWSYATDFDGTPLATSSRRQVNVRIASSSAVSLQNASLHMVGTSGASTTVAAQSGSFSMTLSSSTLNADYFTFAGADTDGLELRASSTFATFTHGLFTVTPGKVGMTIDAATIDSNPTKQLFDIGFATSSVGSVVNVNLDGSPDSFIWFRDGFGSLYGEAYDNNDADPGSIRWDDSSYSISISGTVYDTDGTTPLGGPVCDGSTNNIRVVVDGGAFTTTTSCNGLDGSYTFPSVNYIGDPSIVVYLDTNGGTSGAVVTKTPTADITDMNIYANRVTTRHENTAPLSIADMAAYDNSDDSDLRFIAATGTTDTLTVLPDNGLQIYASTTFTPNGTVTLQSGGSANATDGTLYVNNGATFMGTGTSTYSIGGSFMLGNNATFTAASSTVVMTATTTGKTITTQAGQLLSLHLLTFNGVGGGWNINSNISTRGDLHVATGTVTGTGNITVQTGSFYGDGLVSLGGGKTTIVHSNTLGGSQGWTFNDLTLGDGSTVGTTTPASSATTTVGGTLAISMGHFLDAGSSHWNLTGSSTVFIEDGVFDEGTSVVQYGGTTNANILDTTYYDLRVNAAGGNPTFTTMGAGISVQHDLTIGTAASTSVDLDTHDTALTVTGDVSIANTGILEGSDSATTTVAGSWNNTGVFNANSGTVAFNGTASHSIAPGDSSFATLILAGTGSATIAQNATATDALIIGENLSSFTQQSGTILALGGSLDNRLAGAGTTWSGTTLYMYGNGSYRINDTSTADTYNILHAASGTHVRMWNSQANTINTDQGGSVYSMDHAGVDGNLKIFGNYEHTNGTDYWSYATDFDGTPLVASTSRPVAVYIEGAGTVTYRSGGALDIYGSAAASTTIQNQGSGMYDFVIGNNGSTTMSHYQFTDLSNKGVTFAGTPHVGSLSYGRITVSQNGASGITVGGTALDANPALTFTNNTFATSSGINNAYNVTATGTSVSSWRFTNDTGQIAGEAFDNDPGGDPGFIVWDDSAALITISGRVYSDEGSTVSSACDGSTNDIRLVVAGLTSHSASCNASTGQYSIPNVAFSPGDSVIVYIDGQAQKAAAVTVDLSTNISNMDLYEHRVIVRHESTNPLTIANMAVWDSSDDSDIPFTAIDSTSDSLTLPSDTKLIIWASKEFAPGGAVTLSGGGGSSYDGSLQLYNNAKLTMSGTDALSIGGSMVLNGGATFDPAQSTASFTSNASSRSIDINQQGFYDVSFNGSGSWNIGDATLDAHNLDILSGSVTLPNGTSTISGSFDNSGGSFDINGSPLVLSSSDTGNTLAGGGSDFAALFFTGSGSWNMTDTNATATDAVSIQDGTISLPSGVFAVGKDFDNQGGVFTHNNGTIRLYDNSATNLQTNGSDLSSIIFDGTGPFTMLDGSLSLLDDLTIAQGSVTFATGTLSIGGSFDASGGTFKNATGTVLFNSGSTGNTVDTGSSSFYNVQFGNASGGWTITSDATTTHNFTLSSANSFTQQSGTRLYVGNVFTNLVGGAKTTWSGSTLQLNAGTTFAINTKSQGGDVYGTLRIDPDTDVSAWDSSATTITVNKRSSLYSMDNAGVDGNLYIYGDYHLGTTTQYWSYANDFDGTTLSGGNRRGVSVHMANNATTTIDGGTLNIVGDGSATTTIQNQGSGTYAFTSESGNITAQHFAFSDLNANGVHLEGATLLGSLDYGSYTLATNYGALLTVSSTTVNANAGMVIANNIFSSGPFSGKNVVLVGTTSSAWNFVSENGDLSGEAYDDDGVSDCGSLRWSDSTCQLAEQTAYRWRNDDGGEGVPNSEWFDNSWDKRKRVVVTNDDSKTYTNAVVRVPITYDTDMRNDFADLRFTADDGTTPLNYFLESYTISNKAVVWVKIPSLTANDHTDIYMYYGNVSATTTSNGTLTFPEIDDFEDSNISEYSGDTSLFNVGASFAYQGTQGLDNSGNESQKTTSGIYRTDVTMSQGQTLRYMQYVDTSSGSGDEACTLFGVQSAGSNYGVCLEQFGSDHVSLVRNVTSNETSGTVLATSSATYTTGWHEVNIKWGTDDTITVSVSKNGSMVATTSATDSTYSSGGIGFSYWFNYGGWDVFSARPLLTNEPTVTVGDEQVSGGASWAAPRNTPYAGGSIGSPSRLRMVFANGGLDVFNQQIRLDYAARGAAPSCAAVDASNYVAVPVQTNCGSSPICMVDSSNYVNNDQTTGLLGNPSKTFVSGQMIEDPSNKTTSLDIDNGGYTEVEYELEPTVNANDSAYCFRMTNNGTMYDSYSHVAEMQLSFSPTLGPVTLNNGMDISLTPGTTTRVYATATVTDFNGYADISTKATSTIYRSALGPACSSNTNSCYRSVDTPQCSYSSCSGNSCLLQCYADIYYYADPTDIGTYDGQQWIATLEIEDNENNIDIDSSAGLTNLLSLRALDVNNSINYGALAVSSSTGSYNPTTTVQNLGNNSIDVEVEGTDLSDGVSSNIPASEQRFATSSFNYDTCTSPECQSLSSTSATAMKVDLSKPTSTSTPSTDELFWGIAIPLGISSNPHSGINIFYSIADLP